MYEKSFDSLKVNFQNPRDALIVITSKEEYFARITRRLRELTDYVSQMLYLNSIFIDQIYKLTRNNVILKKCLLNKN